MLENKNNIFQIRILSLHLKFFLIIYSFNFLIILIKSECERNNPIMVNGICSLKYCSEEDYNNNICIKSNEIIKIQWLTNIIKIGDLNFRYINFANYSNGDMIIETTSYPPSSLRMFFGLKTNGLPFFGETNHFSITVKDQPDNTDKSRCEAENFIATINDGRQKGKEYLVSIPKNTKYAELFNFEENDINKIIKQKKATEVLGNEMINFRGSAINYMLDDKYYILFAFKSNLDEGSLILKRFLFNGPDFGPALKKETYQKTVNLGNSLSCFVTDLKYIICSYINSTETTIKIGRITNKKKTNYFCQLVLDKDFNDKNLTIYNYNVNSDPNSFVKGIHLKNEVGVFIYYNNLQSYMSYPILLFKKYNENTNKLENYFSSRKSVELNKYVNIYNYRNRNRTYNNWNNYNYSNWNNNYPSNRYNYSQNNNIYFNNYCLKNDLIKISENKICFTTSSLSNETLYIILLNILENEKIVIRYYSINLFKLYNHKILLDMRAHLFINYIALAFSYCPQESCYTDVVGDHFSAFILFSYPNATDNTLNIEEYLFKNNDIKIDNLIVDIKQSAKIENNIFGYDYYGINIKENNCNYINILSHKTNQIINMNQIIEDEKIELQFINNIYNQLECKIKFSYIFTEPKYEDYTKFLDVIENTYGEFDEATYNEQKDKYEGKIIDYNILLEEELIKDCGNYCELCKKSNTNYCITCKFNYIIDENNNFKNCLEEKTEISTIVEEEKTEISTIIEEEKIKSSTIIEEEKTEISTIIEEEKIKISTIIEEEKPKEEENKLTDKIIIEESDEKEEKTEEIIINAIESDSHIKTCTNDEILLGHCLDGIMKNDQVGEIFNQFKDNVLTNDYHGENKIIQTENVALQISTLEEQKNSLNPDISTIDLGECEKILKDKYNISKEDSLIIIKTDIKSKDLSSTYVQYEVYDPNTLKQLDLNYCKEVKIVVNVPVNLDMDTISLYDSLSESGYNLFDSEDDFYNDICATYTSPNGTDMTLEDRKKEMFSLSGNISMCQEGCIFESYNKTTKKAKCDCDTQTESIETNIDNINFDKKGIGNSFLSTLTNSNFLVLKCYKLALNLSKILKNKGQIIMSIIIFLYIILLLVYCIRDRKMIRVYIQGILKNKITNFNNNKKNKLLNKQNKLKTTNSLNTKINIKKKIKAQNKFKKDNNNNAKAKNNKNNKNNNAKAKNNINNKNNKKKNNKEPPKKNVKNKKSKFSPINTKKRLITSNNKNKLGININIIPIRSINYGKVKRNQNIIDSTYSTSALTNLSKKKQIKTNFLKTDKAIVNSKKSLINETKIIQINNKNLNDQELNNLEYEIAILVDKRTYFQYYWSLLKRKQLILFSFLPSNDYNLFSLKISLFLLSFSLYFTINGFFFSDETMHKIHEDNGAFDILFQIPQILYSSVVSSIINMILKMLSLSEKNILALKQEKDIKTAMQKSKNIEKCLTLKFVIFFMLSNILLIFFWYFISCFCAVYINTQSILIKDTLFSFGLSMIYPFGLNLLPGILRIPALRAQKKDKKCLYKISTIVALI